MVDQGGVMSGHEARQFGEVGSHVWRVSEQVGARSPWTMELIIFITICFILT